MRITHLIALATVSSAASAAAQEPRAAEPRVRTTAPSGWTYDSDGHRAAIGIGTTTTGTLRDTLGLMITSITKGSPAEKAGLEEGNRVAAINGVSLRINKADVEDGEMSNALTRRLTRELSKSKPGDVVELSVYRGGHTSTVKLTTADSDSLFKRVDYVRQTREEMENRPSLGFSIGSTGSRRDTLGVLVMSVSDSSPAAKAGIEEGNRIAAIGGVSLRVQNEDAGDHFLSSTKAQRLQREISALKPGENVTLKVYSNGQFRDVSLKVSRIGDLPKRGGMTYMGGDGFMPAMPAMPMIAPRAFEGIEPRVRMELDGVRPLLEDIGPRVQMELDRVRPQLDDIAPRVQMQLDGIRPLIERVRVQPRVRVVNLTV